MLYPGSEDLQRSMKEEDFERSRFGFGKFTEQVPVGQFEGCCIHNDRNALPESERGNLQQSLVGLLGEALAIEGVFAGVITSLKRFQAANPFSFNIRADMQGLKG